MKRVLVSLVMAWCVLGLGRPAVAAPLVIQYQATDLVDLVAGEDLWRYDYSLSGFDFLANQGFSIQFDPAQYGPLESALPAHAGWDILTTIPDPSLPDAGLYDALALQDHAPLSNPFSATFVWLGGPLSVPGSQLFTVYQLADDGSYLATLQTGVTSPVPEPSSLLLISAGLVGVIARVQRRRG